MLPGRPVKTSAGAVEQALPAAESRAMQYHRHAAQESSCKQSVELYLRDLCSGVSDSLHLDLEQSPCWTLTHYLRNLKLKHQ